MNSTIASKARGYTPAGAIASALAALAAADAAFATSIAGKANLTGGNSLSGDQTLASGSSLIATNGGDWVGVALTGTGLVGKNTSNATTWSVDSETGIGQFAGLGTTPLNASNISSGTVAVARLGSGSPGSSNFLRGDGSWSATLGNNPFTCGQLTSSGVSTNSSATIAHTFSSTYTHSSGNAVAASLTATDSTTGTGGVAAFRVNLAGTGTGSGTKLLADFQTAGTSRFSVTSAAVLEVANPDASANPKIGVVASHSLGTSTIYLGKGVSNSVRGEITHSAATGLMQVKNFSAAGIALSSSTAEVARCVGSALLVGTTTDDGVNKLQVAGSGKFTTSSDLTAVNIVASAVSSQGAMNISLPLGDGIANGKAFAVSAGAEAFARVIFGSDGSLNFGSGSATRDTRLERASGGGWSMTQTTSANPTLAVAGSAALTSGSVTIDNGQYYKAKRNSGGTVISVLGFNPSTNILRIQGGDSSAGTAIIQFANSSNGVLGTFDGAGSFQLGATLSLGGGVGVMGIANATTNPSSSITGGLALYADTGAGKVRTAGGNVVTFAPNTAASVTGSRGGNAALLSLLTALAAQGFITDSTSA